MRFMKTDELHVVYHELRQLWTGKESSTSTVGLHPVYRVAVGCCTNNPCVPEGILVSRNNGMF